MTGTPQAVNRGKVALVAAGSYEVVEGEIIEAELVTGEVVELQPSDAPSLDVELVDSSGQNSGTSQDPRGGNGSNQASSGQSSPSIAKPEDPDILFID